MESRNAPSHPSLIILFLLPGVAAVFVEVEVLVVVVELVIVVVEVLKVVVVEVLVVVVELVVVDGEVLVVVVELVVVVVAVSVRTRARIKDKMTVAAREAKIYFLYFRYHSVHGEEEDGGPSSEIKETVDSEVSPH